jgi:hypothetical protein
MPKKGVRKKARTIVKTVTTERYEPETESDLPDFKDFDSKTTRSKKSKTNNARGTSSGDTEKLLLENFIALQDALVNIGGDLKDLNKKITSMLELFENASKAYQEKPESRSVANKLNEIIEQNQTIAKSILILSKKFKEGREEKDEKEEKIDLNKMSQQMSDFEGFKPSIKSESQDESSESDGSESSEESSDESESKDKGEDDEFTPEPLPDFNF